jgi:hypothetical protein
MKLALHPQRVPNNFMFSLPKRYHGNGWEGKIDVTALVQMFLMEYVIDIIENIIDDINDQLDEIENVRWLGYDSCDRAVM